MPRPATWGRWSPAPHDLARLDACLSLARLGAKVDAFFAGQSDPRDDLQLFADFVADLVADLFHFAANVDLIDTETGASVGEQVARAFSDSEFQWSAVERMLRLASPSPDFRTGVVYCTATVIRLQIMLPQPPYLSLRQKWDEAKGHLDTAAVEINKARQWLDGRGDCDELLAQASESVEVLLRRARTRADKLHGDRRGGRPPMLMFAWFVAVLARVFTHATGRNPTITRNAAKGGYEGPFLVLVEAVLPPLSHILDAAGFPLAQPASAEARGKFILRSLVRDKTSVHEP